MHDARQLRLPYPEYHFEGPQKMELLTSVYHFFPAVPLNLTDGSTKGEDLAGSFRQMEIGR